MSFLQDRECRARQKAMPELNREFRDILVGRPYGAPLQKFLEAHGIHGLLLEESFSDVVTLSSDADLEEVEKLINEWVKGVDFAGP